MARVPPGPPIEPGTLDLEHDLGARDLLRDLGRRDLARDPGHRDISSDAGQQELEVLGASPAMALSGSFGISGGVVRVKKARARPPRDSSAERPVDGP